MACCPTQQTYGYEDSRFENDVDENFHCSICDNVLKEPRTCRNNDHIFCLACISQHLKVNSQTCPECEEHLSVDTLRRSRLVNKMLSKLKINCDYASRGCLEFSRLKDLETHVLNCGYAPVLCSNGECGMEINKQDKVHHETEVCEFGRVKCHDCWQTQQTVGRLEGGLMALDGKVDASVNEIRKIMKAVNEVNEEMSEKVEASSEETKQELWEVRKEVNNMKDNLSKVNKDVDEVKFMMTQVFEKLNILELLNKLPSPAEEMLNTPREDILVAGGNELGNSGKSTEIYSWEKNDWFEVPSMNEEHKEASSFIYQDILFVVGGECSEIKEILDLNELPLKWTKLPGELPYECGEGKCHEMPKLPFAWSRMATVRWRDEVVVLGGEDEDGHVRNNVFMYNSETRKITALPSMLKKRCDCCAVITGNTIVVMGGNSDKKELEEDRKALSSVECFTIGSYSWEYLRPMNYARSGAVAEVLPSGRKYV